VRKEEREKSPLNPPLAFIALPNCIEQLYTLQVLLCQKNSISAIKIEAFPPSLLTLNMSFNLLEAIPLALYNLPNIEALILSSNMIAHIPVELCLNNASLINLDLHTNKLESIPQEISQLKHLRRLNIAINQITKVPTSIGDLPLLEWLNVNDNQLTALPDSIGNLRKLIKFGIVQNKLERLPDSIGQLTQLSKLDMRRNQFRWFPGSILKLRDKQELTQANAENRDDGMVRALRPGVGSLKTILMGENECLQYYEGIVCEMANQEAIVYSINMDNISVEKLTHLHPVSSLSEIAARRLLDTLPAPSGSISSLRYAKARKEHLKNLPARILPSYTLEKIRLNAKQCEACLRLYCDSYIYVAELGCMGDSRVDVPVRFRMCSYRCAKAFMAIDKNSLQLYDEEHTSNGLEALDPPSHNESTSNILQENEHSFELREPSVISTASGKWGSSLFLWRWQIPLLTGCFFLLARHFSVAKCLQSSFRALFSLQHADQDIASSVPNMSRLVTLSNVSSRLSLPTTGRYVTADVSELERF
jgi:Leucine-rich repeat (LRR) protein